jgi:hypothetical protein
LDAEAVVYDPRNGAVHRFNTTTFLVWSLCDGSHTPRDIAVTVGEHHSIDEPNALRVVGSAIAQLQEKGLLHDEPGADARSTDPTEFFSGAVPAHEPGRVMAADDTGLAPPVHAETDTRAQGPSRRDVLGGGVTKAMLAAPVISTFFAAGAYASGVGSADCRPVNYSCTTTSDCCADASEQKCDTTGDGRCCIKQGRSGCVADEDCCGGDICELGTCVNVP